MIPNESPLQRHRRKYQPPLPPLLKELGSLSLVLKEKKDRTLLAERFPQTHALPLLSFEKGKETNRPLKVGVVLSGGQAPGGQNVISGLFDGLKQLNPYSTLIGFLDGPDGIIKNRYLYLTEELVDIYRNQGGFDSIGAGRTKIETEEQFEAAGHTFQEHKLDGLVIVGGDDSNTNAALLAEYCLKSRLPARIIGVPKTIDGDLKNAYIETSFGFDTASKVYSEIIGNLAKDSLSAKKYTFFIKMMGRSASHLALECALQTHANLTLIGEEAAELKYTLNDIANQIANLVCERARENKHYGVVIIPEGLLEFLPDCQLLIRELNSLLSDPACADALSRKSGSELCDALQKLLTLEAFRCFSSMPEQIRQQLLLDRDPHGNIQLSKIETERLLIACVELELDRRRNAGQYAGKFSPQPLFCGYEGRASLPSNFDSQYCYALGHVAALLIARGATGYMCCLKNLAQPVEAWEAIGVPIVEMLHFEVRKNKQQPVIKKALVDLNGPVFKRFRQERDKWKLEDNYLCPGPIQFEGPGDITNGSTMTLWLESN